MDKFQFTYPTHVYFGENAAKTALEKEPFGNTVLLAYGSGSILKNGIYTDIRGLLEQAGKRVIDFPEIMSNPTYRKAQEGARLARQEQVDFILAVGGGSVIDCCKIISAQAKLEEDIYRLEYEMGQTPASGIPLGAIVTASGTGAEMNSGAVITYEEKKWKGALWGTAASFAALDPAFTASVPEIQVLSGAFDTLSHAMETYLGNSDRDNVSDDLALAVMRNVVVNMRRLKKDMGDMQARSNLMWDSAMAENGILKCGRVTDFQAHQIEHQLGAYTDCNHGQGLAVIHPAYYRRICDAAPEKFKRLGQVVFGVEGGENAVAALSDFIRECGLPTRLRQLKSTVPITPELLRQVADSCNLIKTGPRQLSHEDIYDILMECI